MFKTDLKTIADRAVKCFSLCAMVGIMILIPGNMANAADSASSNQVNEDEIAALQSSISSRTQQINDLNSQKTSIQNQKSNVQSIINSLQTSKGELTSYVAELDQELAGIQSNIDLYNGLIEEKEAEIAQTTLELEEAEAVTEAQYEAMKTRIKFMYESGNTMYMELLFTASSFGDMLNKADYINELESYDRAMLVQYQLTVENTLTIKEELEAEQAVLDAAKEAAQEEADNMDALIAEKESEIAGYNADISDQQAIMAEYDAMIAAEQAEIAALEEALKADKDALAAATSVSYYTSGQFVWPAPSYTRISSEFGWRTHPIFGTQKFHSGLDMAAPGGSPILAACEGTVTAAGYSSSMGNYIYVDHGGGLSTVYMHASAIYVSKGDHVTAGQQIGAVGSTGWSTGNHLHFSVRLNGEYVNPWNYL